MLKLAAAQAHMKCINFPIKASVMLRVSNKVLGIFDNHNLPSSQDLLQRISAVRDQLDSVVVMAAELARVSRSLVLRVWTLESRSRRMLASRQAKVLSEAFTRGSEFTDLTDEYAAERDVLKDVTRACTNMTGVHFLA
jgi:hypothetical protein